MDERVDPPRAGVAEDLDRSRGQVVGVITPGSDRVVDVVVDVGDAVHQPHDLALERGRLGRPAGVADDPVADRHRQVQALPVALERVDDPQRVLVVQERGPEPLRQAAVERVLADVAERRMAEIVAEPDRLDEILVERQRARDGRETLRDLERVRQPRAVVVAGRRHEHLRLVLQAAKRLGVDDPVAIALKRRAQTAIGLRWRMRWAGYERVASGESSRSSRSRMRCSNASATGPLGCPEPAWITPSLIPRF